MTPLEQMSNEQFFETTHHDDHHAPGKTVVQH
jgi:hypothetical protein